MARQPGPLGVLVVACILVAACAGAATPAPERPAAASGAADGAAPASAPEPVKLMVPYTPISGVSSPLWVAMAEGLFARQGLEIEAEFFSGGSVPIIQAMVAGEYPIGIPGGGDVVHNRLGGGELLLIGCHECFFTIDAYARPELRGVSDLKGRTIAVTRIGTSSYFAGVAALASAGIKPDEVGFIQSGGVGESAAVLMAGQADAAMIGYPAAIRVEQAGFPRLFSFADLGDYGLYPTAVTAVRDSWLREPRNRDIALRFLRALNAGLQTARTDQAVFKRVVGKYTQTDDEPTLDATFEYFRTYLPQNLRVDEHAIRNTLDLLDHPSARDADPRQFYDNSLVDELARQG
jgi:NitT/TauT family transport system substrate-binding protein